MANESVRRRKSIARIVGTGTIGTTLVTLAIGALIPGWAICGALAILLVVYAISTPAVDRAVRGSIQIITVKKLSRGRKLSSKEYLELVSLVLKDRSR